MVYFLKIYQYDLVEPLSKKAMKTEQVEKLNRKM